MPVVERPDGARVYFEVVGDPDLQPIVLIGGLGAEIGGWRRNLAHLSAELFVVTFDHRGCGRSALPEAAPTMTTYVEDCVGVLDELHLARAHVYGHSFGGAVALELVLTHPDRVRSAILAATHPGAGHAIASTARVPVDTPWLQRYAPAFAEAHPDLVREDLDRQGPRSRRGERAQWEALKVWDAYDRLGDVTLPVLVLHGSEDRLMHPGNGRLLAERIPGAELAILEGAGHAYHLEQPATADELVLDFVRRHRS